MIPVVRRIRATSPTIEHPMIVATATGSVSIADTHSEAYATDGTRGLRERSGISPDPVAFDRSMEDPASVMAQAMISRRLCDMCGAFKSFQQVGVPDETTTTITFACTECGHVHLFLRSNLERHAASNPT